MLFISPQKLFLFLRYLNFCPAFVVEVGKWRAEKAKLGYTSNGIQIITIHILSNISRSKGNQTKKFGQVLERNLRNIFLQESSRK